MRLRPLRVYLQLLNLGAQQSQTKLTSQMKAIIFFSVFDDSVSTRTSGPTNPPPHRAVATPQMTILNQHFRNFRPQKTTPHAAIVPSSIWPFYIYFFAPASPSFLCRLPWMEIMQMEMGTRKKKCWHLSSSPPLNTHTSHTPHSGSFPLALSLLAVSQAHANNRSHVTRTPSCLLAVLPRFIQTEQVLRQIDGALPSVEANSLGLFNFGRQQSVTAFLFEEKPALIGSFWRSHLFTYLTEACRGR